MTYVYFVFFDHYVLMHNASWAVDVEFLLCPEPEVLVGASVYRNATHVIVPASLRGTSTRPAGWVLLHLHRHPSDEDAKVVSVHTAGDGDEFPQKLIAKHLAPFLRRYSFDSLLPVSEFTELTVKGTLYFEIKRSPRSVKKDGAADCCVTAFRLAKEHIVDFKGDDFLWYDKFQQLVQTVDPRKRGLCLDAPPDDQAGQKLWLKCLIKAFLDSGDGWAPAFV